MEFVPTSERSTRAARPPEALGDVLDPGIFDRARAETDAVHVDTGGILNAPPPRSWTLTVQ